MPLFKFGYVDPTLRYAELLIEARVTPWFELDHVPDTGILDFQARVEPFFDAVLPEDIVVPLVSAYFEAELGDTLIGNLGFSIPGIQLYILSEDNLLSDVSFSLRPEFVFDVLVPNLNATVISLKASRVEPSFYIYAPVIAEVSIELDGVLLDFEVYEANRASLFIPLRQFSIRFDASALDLQALFLEIPAPNFLFHGFSGLAETELSFVMPTPIFDFFCGQDLTQIDDGIIRFDYEPYMLELLKSVRPEYAELIICFELEQEE